MSLAALRSYWPRISGLDLSLGIAARGSRISGQNLTQDRRSSDQHEPWRAAPPNPPALQSRSWIRACLMVALAQRARMSRYPEAVSYTHLTLPTKRIV